MRHISIVLALLLGFTLLPGCKKTELAPVTGDLSIVITRPFYYTLKTYSLYTENSYGIAAAVNPLRQGSFSPSQITSGTERLTTTLTDLNAGNYVFTFGGLAISVQVTPGQTNTFYYVIR